MEIECVIEEASPSYTSKAMYDPRGDSNMRASCRLEQTHGQAIYGVAFNHFRKQEHIFATATVYRCEEDGTFQFLQCYVDADETEEFYVCLWSIDRASKHSVLLLAGKKGIVRVLDTRNSYLVNTLVGHGQAINDLAIFPTQPQIILTASKDESARMWNYKTGVTLCTVSGDGGHTAEDGHMNGTMFVTSGMDDCIKVWSLKNSAELVTLSENWDVEAMKLNFPTVDLEYPLFSSKAVHGNYVDCVRWYGDLIISKGVDERVIIFKPMELPEDPFSTTEKFTTLLEFQLAPCEVWFVRFSFDFEFRLLVCGNQNGVIHGWNLEKPTTIQHFQLQHKQCNTVIRQTAVSFDGSIILAACDSGEVWRWDRDKSRKASKQTPTDSS